MNYLLDIVQGFDLRIYHFLGRFAGNWFIDRFVYFQESEEILKGGLVLAAYWWAWFRGGTDREKRRKAIIAIMYATVLAVVVTRILAAVTPFRLRPIYVPNLEHPWSIPAGASFAQWNSFPSDTSAYFCALAFGLIVLLPRLKVPIVLYTAGWICFPRVFLGYHYASDAIARCRNRSGECLGSAQGRMVAIRYCAAGCRIRGFKTSRVLCDCIPDQLRNGDGFLGHSDAGA